jgi:hypothetical protein
VTRTASVEICDEFPITPDAGVAIAVMYWPTATLAVSVVVKVALPAASSVMVARPIDVRAW